MDGAPQYLPIGNSGNSLNSETSNYFLSHDVVFTPRYYSYVFLRDFASSALLISTS
jgi:hypothetical protein